MKRRERRRKERRKGRKYKEKRLKKTKRQKKRGEKQRQKRGRQSKSQKGKIKEGRGRERGSEGELSEEGPVKKAVLRYLLRQGPLRGCFCTFPSGSTGREAAPSLKIPTGSRRCSAPLGTKLCLWRFVPAKAITSLEGKLPLLHT